MADKIAVLTGASRGLGRSIAVHLARAGVDVIGTYNRRKDEAETDFSGGAVRDNQAVNQAIAATVPLGRLGLPDDVGGAVATILSDGFSWVNGTRIEVSGGQNV